jgi:hypothetical protein
VRDDHGHDAAVLRARSAIKALLAYHSAEAMLRALDLEIDARDGPGEEALDAEPAERGAHGADLQDPVYMSRQRARAKLAMLRDGVR